MGLAELEPIHTSPDADSAPDSVRDVALRWVADFVFVYLLESGPMTGRDLLPVANRSAPIGPKTLKYALETDPRIEREDRRWAARPAPVDARRPLERSIVSLIGVAGRPLTALAIGQSLAAAYSREPEALAELASRLTQGRRELFSAGHDLIALKEWLLDAAGDSPDDVEFENFEDTSEIDALKPLADGIDGAAVPVRESALRLLDRAGRPVSNKALQFLVWRSRPKRFDAAGLFRQMLEEGEARLVSPASWIGPQATAALAAELDRIEASAPVELTNDDVPKPITVEPEDVEELAGQLSARPISTAELLARHFPDLRSDDPNYRTTLGSLDKLLRSDPRFMWAGWDRWSAPQPIPDSAREFPANLIPVMVDIEIAAGQQEDIELDDEGLEGNLAQEIQNPLVKYGSSVVRAPDGTLRCTVTFGLREAGVLSVGDEDAAFPRQPPFLLAMTTDEAGETRAHWINNELRLMYNLGDWYTIVDLPPTGGIFTLQPQTGPGDYLIAYGGENDPETYLDANRMKDLAALRERSIAQETSTREIIQEIMGHHSKGVSFPELFAEVTVARMTSARMIASILSSYYEFYPKGRLWLFNERDAAKGFKKQKKKYLRRR